ncbi:MAG: 3-deoxy-7-phosphoheptulonate synthase [Legionellaceae bacterium]|nr:3-deoxy-7-phosphoheptulonate synthase [Legionellaceae bacterium]
MTRPWTPTSWLSYPNPQAPVYQDEVLLDTVLAKLNQYPPLVSKAPILALKQTLADAAMGRTFILQGGDCAESFQDCRPAVIRAQLQLIRQMAQLIERHIHRPTVPIGRIAGQFAKPRSLEYETKDNTTLPSYRGDLINAKAFNAKAREPNPNLLLKGYASAKHTLQFIHAIQKSVPFYTSHEALHLPYEAALTRQCGKGLWYNLSTHLPWIGVRTAQVDGAHVEFLRGIENPVGIKVGPSITPEHLIALINTLNPNQEKGRILLITRLGTKHVTELLPALIQAVQAHMLPVTWSCDPMHGNTEVTQKGIKTRHIDNVWHELKETLHIHDAHQSHLGGIHLEITPDPVTECLGGKGGPTEKGLEKAYKSLLDPRLNKTQALDIAQRFGAAYQV